MFYWIFLRPEVVHWTCFDSFLPDRRPVSDWRGDQLSSTEVPHLRLPRDFGRKRRFRSAVGMRRNSWKVNDASVVVADFVSVLLSERRWHRDLRRSLQEGQPVAGQRSKPGLRSSFESESTFFTFFIFKVQLNIAIFYEGSFLEKKICRKLDILTFSILQKLF